MGQLALIKPYEIARDGDDVILAAEADLDKLRSIETMAQLWRPRVGYFKPERLQAMFKFLYEVTETTPPIPWIEPS